MSEPTTAAGRALWADFIVDESSERTYGIRIAAIEREAVAAWKASPEAVEELARAMEASPYRIPQEQDRFDSNRLDPSEHGGPDCRIRPWSRTVAADYLAALRDQR